MSDAAGDARQRAEARRQKILARQRDRLQAITGVYTEAPGKLTVMYGATVASGPLIGLPPLQPS
jgi:hypothetical protein